MDVRCSEGIRRRVKGGRPSKLRQRATGCGCFGPSTLPRAAHDTGLDVGTERYHNAMGYLLEEAALLGDEHTAFDAGTEHPHGFASYFFTRRTLKLLEE
jgi:hypothetical protein